MEHTDHRKYHGIHPADGKLGVMIAGWVSAPMRVVPRSGISYRSPISTTSFSPAGRYSRMTCTPGL